MGPMERIGFLRWTLGHGFVIVTDMNGRKRRTRGAACELKYRSNFETRTLRKGRTHLIGVLLHDIAGSQGALILRSIEQFVWPRGFLCITGVHRDRGTAPAAYAAQFVRCGVEGMITVDVSFPYGSPLPIVAVKTPENPFAGRYEGTNSTAFRQFVEQLGENAAETLLAQIEDDDRPCVSKMGEIRVDC